MKTRANEKKTKDLKSNVVTISANNQKTNYSEEPYRKKLNLKKRIKTIQRNIKFINNFYTLIAVVISFFIQIRIMDMCDEITRELFLYCRNLYDFLLSSCSYVLFCKYISLYH